MRAEDAAERYRTLLDSIEDGFCVVEVLFDDSGSEAVDYRFLEVNPSFSAQTGLDDVVGRTVREIAPGIGTFWIEAYGHVARTGESKRFERYEPTLQRWFDVQAIRTGRPEQRRVALLFRDVTARHAAEERARRSELEARRAEQFAVRVMDNLFAFVGVLDPSGTLLDANRAPLVAAGLDIDDVRGKKFWDCYWWSHDARIQEQLRSACRRAAAGETIRYDAVVRVAGDTRLTIDFQLAPLRDEGGVVTHLIPSAVDITGRKANEVALRESEARTREAADRAAQEGQLLDAILGAAPAAIIVADAKGKLLRFNPANELLWGPAPLSESVEGYSAWRGWWADGSERHGRRIEPHEWAMSRALRGETVRNDIVEIEPFDQPGVRRTMVNSGAPVRDAAGRITGAVVAQMDISRLVAAEAMRRESEARFRALADNIAQLAWMTDETGYISWYNRRWYEFTGTTLEEMKGWGWQNVHHPEHVGRVLEKYRHHLVTGEPWEDTFPLRRWDGHYRWFLSRAFPLRESSGRIVSWFGTNTDITAQVEAEEALREADRRKDEFIAILAHELRNPLAPVRTAAYILKKSGPSEPTIDRARDVIERQVTHMARLIDDLLDVSRLARGKLSIAKETCDLAAIAVQTADDYRSSFEAKGIELSVEQSTEAAWVDGDPVRLAQMIGNLLHNAARFTDEGGRVALVASCDARTRTALVTVTDSGVGMDPALMSRLFDPFSQAKQDLARSRGGLGLGLALTKGLAELHGGTVLATSDGLTRGSTFTLRVPLCRGRQPEATSSELAAGGMRRLRVLVIEDNEDAAEMLTELLRTEGHDVELAFDGLTGLRRAASFLPEVVISDIGLPGALDGYAVARQLRRSPTHRRALLVALSGYASEDARMRSREAGFDAHLAKPASPDALGRILRDRAPE